MAQPKPIEGGVHGAGQWNSKLLGLLAPIKLLLALRAWVADTPLRPLFSPIPNASKILFFFFKKEEEEERNPVKQVFKRAQEVLQNTSCVHRKGEACAISQ